MKKKSETLEQQRRAREEFLRLKKMQQGEITPEPKPSEVAQAPTDFKGKVQNFWYHHKGATLVALFLAAVLAISVAQCVNRVEPDLEVVLYSYHLIPDSAEGLIAAYFEPMMTDRNGDGKVKVQVINCSFTEGATTPQYEMTVRQKLQALIVADQSAMLFLCDKDGYRNLEELGLPSDQNVLLGEAFYAACTPQEGALPKDLQLLIRKVDGTAFAGKKQAEVCRALAEEVLKKTQE